MSAWDPDKIRVQIARDLREIRRLYAGLSVQVYYSAVGHDVANLAALNLLGPAAKLSEWERIFDEAEADYFERLALGEVTEADRPRYADDQVDEYHPLGVLASWEDVVRDELGTATGKPASVKDAAKYLAASIPWMFDCNEFGDMNFIAVDQLAIDLAQCRARLENVLKDGTRAEFTRVRCIAAECETHPRLMKLWAAQARWDRYRCPECKTEYDGKQYAQAKAQNLHDEGASRFVRPADASKASGVPKNTMRSWMRRGDVLTALEAPTWNRLVWWPDVRERAVERAARLKAEAIERARRKAEREAKDRAEAEEAMSS